MATTLASLVVRVGADVSGVTGGFNALEKRTRKLGKSMEKLGSTLTRSVSLPLAFVGAAAVKMASDAEEAGNKFNVVMGGSADAVRQRLERLAETIPLTTAQMEGMTAGIQDLLVPMGLARDVAAGMSADMVELAGDLGSFNNVDPSSVLEAMKSALAGSSEPMRRFGVDTRVARLQALALENGLIGLGDKLDNTTTAQAVMLAIQEDSTDAMGDAARTVDSTANSMKFLARDIKQLGINIGQVLIPMVRPMIDGVNDFLKVLTRLNPETLKTVAVIGAIAVVGGPALIVLGKLAVAVRTVTLAAIAFNAVLLKGGIATIIAGGGLAIGIAAVATAAALLIPWLMKTTAELKGMAENADTAELSMRLLAGTARDVSEAGLTASLVRAGAQYEGLRVRIDEAKQAMFDSMPAFERVGKTVEDMTNSAIQGMEEELQQVGVTMNTFSRQLAGIAAGAVPAVTVAVTDAAAALHIANVEFREMGVTLPTAIGNMELIAPAVAKSVFVLKEAEQSMSEFGLAVGSVTIQGIDAFVGFATGAGDSISDFVKRALRDLTKLAARMLFMRAIMSAMPGVGSFLGFGGMPGIKAKAGTKGKAVGGPVRGGTPYIVGERGPEMFMPSQSGTIVPNHAMAGGLTGADVLAAVGPPPQYMSPEAAATTDYYRRLISAAWPDMKSRGGGR